MVATLSGTRKLELGGVLIELGIAIPRLEIRGVLIELAVMLE